MTNPIQPDQFTSARFQKALQIISSLPVDNSTLNPTIQERLEFYGLYKQATVGNCTIPKPPIYDLVARSKWESWCSYKDIKELHAKEKYVELLVQFLKKFPDIPQANTLVNAFERSRRGSDPEMSNVSNEVLAKSESDTDSPVPLDEGDLYSDEDQMAQSGSIVEVPRPNTSYASRKSRNYSTIADYPDQLLSSHQYNSEENNNLGHSSPSLRSSRYLGNMAYPQTLVRSGNDYRDDGGESSSNPEAERALEYLQTQVAALNERIEILRREIIDREKKKQLEKHGVKHAIKTIFKHTFIDFVIATIVFGYFYRKGHPLAIIIGAQLRQHLSQIFLAVMRTLKDAPNLWKLIKRSPHQ
ncbi:Acyl-CoA binding domain containing 5 [Basidiobolus ranarum]|uniref:Acyl-CoA binding domain containing 5 n=1 Tax=Basidiobolus ranarum TaxID=34480 RepID=A0ABR2WJM0_9FUNG